MRWARVRLARPSRVAARAAELAPGDDPRVVLLGPGRRSVARALRRRLPAAAVLAPAGGPEDQHVALVEHGPVDLIVDTSVGSRLRHFRACFFHLRPGGSYLVAGGADELGPEPGPLGRVLRAAAASAPEPLRVPKVRPRLSDRRALRDHVRVRAAGDDLVLVHDLPDVFAEVREEMVNDLLPRLSGGHRVLKVLDGGVPPLPDVREGPVPRTAYAGLGLCSVPLSLRDYREAVVAPYQLVLAGRVVLPDSFRHNQSTRLRSKALASVSPGHSVPVQPLPERVPRMDGTFLHLDDEARGHFGHLLTETLSRVWSWPEALALDPDARVVVCATRKRPALMDYEREIYAACGIPRDRVVVAEGPTRVERLLSGTPMLCNPHYVHPRIVEIWDLVGDRLAAGVGSRPPQAWPRRIFVGRRGAKRRCRNAAEVEALFHAHGFETVYPEDHGLGDQVRMFRSAEVVGGFGGSGLFHLALVPEAKRVVEVVSDAYSARNEFLIAAVRRHRTVTVVCRAERREFQSPFRYDDAREGPVLRAALATL
ncbi:glycosyltransferase family 61 protein [Nocardioides sp. BYT-33-1]|uniref:glycosyltransferase family 61 protein n=1 Tax=Nocardioides sp. BYT-33-1 TaxID=3416952 RepID=UPI003F532941